MSQKLLIALAITLLCCKSFAQQPLVTPLNPQQSVLINAYVKEDNGKVRPALPLHIIDRSIVTITFDGATRGSAKHPRKFKHFDPKKDDINNVVVEEYIDQTGVGPMGYELTVAHKDGSACDMNEFNITFEDGNFRLNEDGDNCFYDIVPKACDFIDGTAPIDGYLVITHTESGLSTRIHYTLHFKEGDCKWPGQNGAYLFENADSKVFPGLHSLLNLADGTLYIIRGNAAIDVCGKDGADGADGYNGYSGMDDYTYRDSYGVYQYVSGTCGSPGSNGEDGKDGSDGGNALVLIGANSTTALNVLFYGGKEGHGGLGGRGGRHGRGSYCYSGYSTDGHPGRDGRPGRDGSVQYVYLECSNLLHDYYPKANMEKRYPFIFLDKSRKNKTRK